MVYVIATDSKPHQTPDFPVAQNVTCPTGTACVGRETSVHGLCDSCWLKTIPNAPPASLWLKKTRPAQLAPPAWAGKLQCMVHAIAAGSKPHQTLSRLPCSSKHDLPNQHRLRGPRSFSAWSIPPRLRSQGITPARSCALSAFWKHHDPFTRLRPMS